MRISPSCYALVGLYFLPPWGVNAGFIVGKNTTLIVDTGANYYSARTVYGYARGVKEDNSFIAVNTEGHLDHLGGNSFFRDEGISVYGHSLIDREEREIGLQIEDFSAHVQDRVRRESNEAAILFEKTRITNPDIRISEDTELDLGNKNVHIIMTPGHTTANLSVYLPSEGVLFCGDCIVNRFIPNLGNGLGPEWQTWLKSLDRIEELSPEIIVPGHGDVLKGKKAVRDEIGRIRSVLAAAISSGAAPT